MRHGMKPRDISFAAKWKRPFHIIKEYSLIFAGSIVGTTRFCEDYPKRPIFVLGSPRSGTTLLARMISLHPMVANFSEGIWVWDPKDRNPMRDHVKRAHDVTRSDYRRIKGCFCLYQKLCNRPIFVNKNPRSSVRIPFICRIFPGCKIIHIVRDGRAVVNSIINRIEKEPFRKKNPLGNFCKPPRWRQIYKLPIVERHSHQWVGILEEITTSQHLLSQDSWFEIRYEDLCTDTAAVMSEIFAFMEIQASETFREQLITIPVALSTEWRNQMSSSDIDIMNSIMAEWLHKYGYDRHGAICPSGSYS